MSARDRDKTKLPKWAQSEIDRLERDLASAYKKLNAGPDNSDTFADTYSETRRPLGQGTSISFEPIGSDGWGNRFTVHLDGKTLVVQGGDGLAVFPRASNSVYLTALRYDKGML